MWRFYCKPGGVYIYIYIHTHTHTHIYIYALNNRLEGKNEGFSTNKKQMRKITQKLYI